MKMLAKQHYISIIIMKKHTTEAIGRSEGKAEVSANVATNIKKTSNNTDIK